MILLLGDSLEVLKTLPDNSLDACVTDPPYGLAFMGKKWDYDVPSVELWREVLRVLKPGAHLLSFGGTRTYHRMTVAIEDAGFEIRDQVQWLYGSGFPKSLNVAKAIESGSGRPEDIRRMQMREDYAPSGRGRANYDHGAGSAMDAGATQWEPTTDDAKRWAGWGTALKPANEPICVARKPLEKGLTIAENVQKWGTGAINVDAGRIATDDRLTGSGAACLKFGGQNSRPYQENFEPRGCNQHTQGRWPANVIFDEAAAEVLDGQSGVTRSGAMKREVGAYEGDSNTKFLRGKSGPSNQHGDSGGASRFFYVAKASKRERNAGLDKTDLIWENDAWEKPDLKLALTGMFQLAKGISADLLTDESLWSTDMYGHSISEQYPKGMTYTISTALKLITELKTWSASPSYSIRESIQDAIRMIEANGLSLAESVEFTKTWSVNTTSEKTASLLGAVSALLPTLLQIKGFARSGNFHSTVKPIKLMEYLIKLVTPPGGTVLDPFMGSGSTGVAAKRLGFKFTGIELSPEYFEIAKRRTEAE